MYCTIQDIENAISRKSLAELSNDNDPSVVDESIVNAIISNSTNVIDEYLRGRYSLPLTETYSTITSICVDLCVFDLYKRRNKLTDNVKYINDSARKKLLDYQKGLTTLKQDAPGEGVLPRSSRVKVNSREKKFSEDLLKGFRI